MISKPSRPFSAYGFFPGFDPGMLANIGQQASASAGASTAGSWMDLASSGLDTVGQIWSAHAGAQTAKAQSLTAQSQAQALIYQQQAQTAQAQYEAQTAQAQIASRNQLFMIGGLLGLAAIAVFALRR